MRGIAFVLWSAFGHDVMSDVLWVLVFVFVLSLGTVPNVTANSGHVIWFDDEADTPVQQCCVQNTGGVFNGFMQGRFRPVDKLGRCALRERLFGMHVIV